ncbi:hypothetical protein JAAARDRAFT_78424 [Jaapia argillacea MUCL 33604]|uniref:Uncharacterized protein n=1 Tax=Jaapia argillacea MUCL 33604 TaxID=933084 RepID=A0A067Q5U0_9AGAM|nr:hypothetical protein JAAARDRAFT_78424 [Jaapia argillacea MUCL 33604]
MPPRETTLMRLPRLSRRWASTSSDIPKPTPRKGRKGHLYGPKPEHPPVTPEEYVRITKRRISKAERDERMDVTLALTPVKTYMGGFTRPRDIRTSNWWTGGRYKNMGKVYESPPPAAYTPHTVFLLESRYTINHGIGRADTPEWIVGVCREGDLIPVLQFYNSADAPGRLLDLMDNARWPKEVIGFKGGPKKLKRVKWWADDEDPRAIIREIWEDENADTSSVDGMLSKGRYWAKGDEEGVEVIEADGAELDADASSSLTGSVVPTELLATSSTPPSPSPTSPQKRSFHTSTRRFHEDPDSIVPEYYIERKRQRDAVAERKDEEGDLMHELSEGILSDDIAATTIPKDAKVPSEVTEGDGITRHPSGFVVPGPGDAPDNWAWESRVRDKAEQTVGVVQRVTEESGLKGAVEEGTLNAVTRPKDEKIPVELPRTEDGRPVHASGYVPPVPNTSFPPGSVKNGRSFHTSALVLATEIPHAFPPFPIAGNKPTKPSKPSKVPRQHQPPPHVGASEFEEDEEDFDEGSEGVVTINPAKSSKKALEAHTIEARAIRYAHIPTLAETPFWRPLLTVTVSTRSLALTLSRLSKGLERGLPYHAALSNEEKKSAASQTSRTRCLRLDRMQFLAVEMAKILHGQRGGMLGIRFNTEEPGRGIDGYGFEDPIPIEKRMIQIGLGNWYHLKDEVAEAFVEDSKDTDGGLKVFSLDDFGNRTNEVGEQVPWRENEQIQMHEIPQESPEDEFAGLPYNERRRRMKIHKQELANRYAHEMALNMAQSHRSVVSPMRPRTRASDEEFEDDL